jgi:DNA-3-methyladenine glycosylase II
MSERVSEINPSDTRKGARRSGLRLDDAGLRHALDQLAARDARLAAVIEQTGLPASRMREPGYETLLRTIVGQQVSVAAAAAVWNRLEAMLGTGCPPDALMARDADALRGCGLSRQKQGYARSLAELVITGALDLDNLPHDDEEAIARLVLVKGIGRWSAEIYLLFAEGRPDIWPAGDLAVQVAVGRIAGLDERPTEKAVRAIAEDWRPWRGAAAILAWHQYNSAAM